MKAVLVSGGEKIDKKILFRETKDAYIICADGGIKNFIDTNLLPDLLVGDLDSIDDMGKRFVKEKKILVHEYPKKKNLTDTELAVSILVEKGFNEISILSATGTRMDHTIANMLLLEYLYDNNIFGKLIDNNNEIIFKSEEIFKVFKDNYKYLSLISISDELIYSTNGMEYETDHLNIKRYSARGVSNEIKDVFAEINIHSGKALIIKSND